MLGLTFARGVAATELPRTSRVKMVLSALACIVSLGFTACDRSKHLSAIQPNTEPPPVADAPQDEPPIVVVDLATVRAGETVSRTLEVKNDTSDTWQISGLRSSCSCALLNISNRTVAPSETLLAKLSYKASASSVDDNRILWIDRVGIRPLAVQITARVRTDMHLSRPSLKLGGPDGLTTGEITVSNFTDRDWSGVTIADSENRPFKVNVSSVEDGRLTEARQTWLITLAAEMDRIKVPQAYGLHVESIEPAQEVSARETLHLELSPALAVDLVPKILALDFSAADSVTKTFVLKAALTDEPFSPELTASDPRLRIARCVPRELGKGRWTMLVEFAYDATRSDGADDPCARVELMLKNDGAPIATANAVVTGPHHE